MGKGIRLDKLDDADPTVDAVHEGGTVGNVSDDPLGRLVSVADPQQTVEHLPGGK